MNTLKCSSCEKDKLEKNFPVNRTKPHRNYRGYICLECQRLYKKTLNYPPCTYPLVCIKCKEEKEAECFSKNKRVPRGRNSTCKECMRVGNTNKHIQGG